MVKPSSSSSKSNKGVRNSGERGKEYPINGGYGRYKGVRMRKWGKWVTEMRLPNCRDRVWLASYDTPEKAARAYDAAVFCIRGPSAMINFPSTPPPHSSSQQQLTTSEIQALASRYAHEEEDTNRKEELKVGGGGDDVHDEQVVCLEAESISDSCRNDMLLFDSLLLDGFLPNWEDRG